MLIHIWQTCGNLCFFGTLSTIGWRLCFQQYWWLMKCQDRHALHEEWWDHQLLLCVVRSTVASVTALHVNLRHCSPQVTYIILSPSCCLFCGSFHASVINVISFNLLAPQERSHRHCWVLCPGTMLVNQIPMYGSSIVLSADLIDIAYACTHQILHQY